MSKPATTTDVRVAIVIIVIFIAVSVVLDGRDFNILKSMQPCIQQTREPTR